jgi:hypothetical protein
MEMNNTQPIEPLPEQPITTVPERLQNILDALTEYHRNLLLEYSHFTQSPKELLSIETLLREKAKMIRNFLLFNKVPENMDPKLQDCLAHLKSANTPWDPEVSTLTDYWCDLMFIKHPFTMSAEHINNLLHNSMSTVEDDTELPQSDDEN